MAERWWRPTPSVECRVCHDLLQRTQDSDHWIHGYSDCIQAGWVVSDQELEEQYVAEEPVDG